MNFYTKLLNSTDPLSSKRFISINTWFLFAVVVIAALFGHEISEFYIYALISLILGQSAMSLVSNRSTIKAESNQPTYAVPSYNYDVDGNYNPQTTDYPKREENLKDPEL